MMNTSNKICNDGASKSNNDDVCEVIGQLQNMSTTNDNDGNSNEVLLDICANCGKEGTNLNICNRCKMVKYCNAACKKKHRSKHKKKCDRRVAELHDDALFKQPPPQYEDCPICFLPMPSLDTGRRYNTCCGKMICSGCCYANANINLDKQLCAFCRTPAITSDEEMLEREKKRAETGDAEAMNSLGIYYANGDLGLRKYITKSLELWHRAGELGHASAYHNIGNAYKFGTGVEFDQKKAFHYYELAAMTGHTYARHNLGNMEDWEGNVDRAIKHYMIAVRGGDDDSLKRIQRLYSNGNLTKDEYTQALQSYQEYLGEIKSIQRDEAASYSDNYKYY